MYDERIEKIMENNPSLSYYKEFLKNGIIVISPNTQKYLNDFEKLNNSSGKPISKQLVIDMLYYDDSYKKLKKIYVDDIYCVQVCFVDENGKYLNQTVFTRNILIELLRQIDINKYPFIASRYNEFMDFVSFDKYKEKHFDEVYNFTIDNHKYSIFVKDIFEFMDLSIENINNIMRTRKYYNNGIPTPNFLYGVNQFYEDNKILEKYEVSEEIKEKLKLITSSKIVDVQMLNKYLVNNDSLFQNIQINEDLENEILKDLPSDYTELEKAIYIYIKMCKLLTYDEEYYVVNQTGKFAEKHKSINNVYNISLSNNKVVCYEFNAIYSYLLQKIGLNYLNFVNTEKGELEFDEDFNKYSDGHMFLKFRCDKFLIKADSVTTILHGDIMRAKLNQPLKGLVCENINEKSRDEFSQVMHKVYMDISEREPRRSLNAVGKIETFDDIAAQFVHLSDKYKPIDIREKVEILISKVNSTKMIGIDAYSYLLQLRKILFTGQEQKDNIKISIIRSSSEKSAAALAVISLRLPDETGQMVITRYLFRPGLQLMPITKENLQKDFANGSLEYIREEDPKIPGIGR